MSQTPEDREAISNRYHEFSKNEGGKDFVQFLAQREAEHYRQMSSADTNEKKVEAVDKLMEVVTIRDMFLRKSRQVKEVSTEEQG